MNPVPGGLFQRKEPRVAHVHTTWLTGNAGDASIRQGNGVITINLPDGITVGAVEGDHAEECGRTLIRLGQQVLVLNGNVSTDQDDLIVRAFLDGEGLGQASAGLFRRFIAYRDGVHAFPYDADTLADLNELAQ